MSIQVGVRSTSMLMNHGHMSVDDGGKLTKYSAVFNDLTIPLPVGTILPFVPGYMTNGSNAGYVFKLGTANTIAAVNAYLNPKGWYVCDGALLNDPDSPIFNGAGRYLPNMIDGRFFKGQNASGDPGTFGAHIHTTPDHNHGKGTLVGSQPTHTHNLSGNSGNQSQGHTHNMSGHEHHYWKSAETSHVQGEGPNPADTSGVSNDHKHSININTNAKGNDVVSIDGSVAGSGNLNTGAASALNNVLNILYIMRVK